MRTRRPRSYRLELRANLSPPLHQLVVGLQAKKESFRYPEIARETQVGISCDSALAEYDLVNATRRYADRVGESSLRQSEGLQEILKQDFTRMRVVQQVSGSRRFRLRTHCCLSRRSKSATGH